MIIGKITSENLFTFKGWATFLFCLYCIRYIPLETASGPSMVKTAAAAFCVLLFITTRVSVITKASVICFIYFIYILTSASFHPESFRWSTILYLASFLITYMVFYELVHVEKVFSLDYFIRLVRGMIFAYFIVLVIQQIMILLGVSSFPLLNFNRFLNIGLGANSLSGEPSTFARIIGVLFYAYLKCNEYKQRRAVNIQQIFNHEHRYVTFAYLWCMFTMGSGTAFICLGVISLYFMKGAYFVFAIPIFFAVYSILNYYEVRQFKRAAEVVEATTTLDVEEVRETDGSAAVRIAPILNTINNIDLGSGDSWFGHGIDYSYNVARKKGIRMINEIDDYGLVAYGLGLILVFSCSMDFFSLGTIMYFTGIGGGLGNIAYQWGILMIFVCVRYFHHNHQYDEDEEKDDDENEDE